MTSIANLCASDYYIHQVNNNNNNNNKNNNNNNNNNNKNNNNNIEKNISESKGKFIIIEGIDGSGKSSILEYIINELDKSVNNSINESLDKSKDKTTHIQDIVHNKGFNKEGIWGKYINTHPSSIKYYLDMIIKSVTYIRPTIRSGKTILQERYIQSIDTFLPDANYLRNKLFRKITSKLFINPELYVYVTASIDECINRLREGKCEYSIDKKYHDTLIADKNKLLKRKNEYDKIYDSHIGNKILIDTTNKSVEESATVLLEKLRVMNYVN